MFNKPKPEPRRERLGAADQKRTPYTRYYQRGPQPATKPDNKKSLADLLSKLLNAVITAILVFSAAYSLIDRKVSVGAVSSGSLHTKAEYNHSLNQAVSSPAYRIKPLFNEGQVSRKLQHDYPEITDVNYDIPWLGSQIIVKIETARPVLKLTSQKAVLVIDEQGRAITNTDDVKKSTLDSLPLVEDQTGYQAVLGQQALTKQQIQFIETVNNQLKAKNLPPTAIILPPKAQELDVRLVGVAYYVKFYMGGDPLVQCGAYLATKQKLDKEGPAPVEYVDVRVEDRVFTK